VVDELLVKPDPLTITYNGLDADRHEIEVNDLSASLKGLGRIIGVVGTFAITHKLVQHSDARPIKVLVGPPKEGSVTFQAIMEWVDQHSTISGITSGLIVTLVGYVITKAAGQREEMKHLRALAEEAIRQLGSRDETVISRLLDTVDKMADTLKPSARQAVKPIGSSASTLAVGGSTAASPVVIVDKAMRDAIDAETPPEIGEEVQIRIRFSEMNLDSKACRLAIDTNADQRYAGEITDPEVLVPNNVYATAFAAQTFLTVRAKPTLKSGDIEKWYISAVIPEAG